MNFEPNHYVPVLKIKKAEKSALALLSASTRTAVTPLLEIVERTAKPRRAYIESSFKGLANSLVGFPRCFIDTREIAPDGPAGAFEAFQHARSDGIAFTPVTGVSRTVDVEAAMQHRTLGVAIRLDREELEAGSLGARVDQFMAEHGLVREDTDLIMDLGSVDDMLTIGAEALASAFLAEVPPHTAWRTFTLSACAFPPSMGGVDRHSYAVVERTDWLAWRDGLHARRSTLDRLPVYSDGAIQHPQGVEGFNPRTMQVSAAIRYTTDEKWLLIKGESTRRSKPTVQFQELATQLVYGHLRPHFRGAAHCAGCASMRAAADGAPKLGSLEVWSRLGTIHHITTVVEELQALTWP